MLTVDDSDQILPADALGPNQLWTSISEEEKLLNSRRKLCINKYFTYIFQEKYFDSTFYHQRAIPPYKINPDVPRIKARISRKHRIGPSFVMGSRKTPFIN